MMGALEFSYIEEEALRCGTGTADFGDSQLKVSYRRIVVQDFRNKAGGNKWYSHKFRRSSSWTRSRKVKASHAPVGRTRYLGSTKVYSASILSYILCDCSCPSLLVNHINKAR